MQFRLTETLHKRAEASAKREGISLSEFAREALRRRCEDSERAAGEVYYTAEPRAPGYESVTRPFSDDPWPFLPPGVDHYDGEILDGLPHGEGVMEWSDGTRYEGAFREGRPSGKGTFTRRGG